MAVKDRYGNEIQYRGGGPRPRRFYFGFAELRDIFGVTQRTLERWIDSGRLVISVNEKTRQLSPDSLLSILDLYNKRKDK